MCIDYSVKEEINNTSSNEVLKGPTTRKTVETKAFNLLHAQKAGAYLSHYFKVYFKK